MYNVIEAHRTFKPNIRFLLEIFELSGIRAASIDDASINKKSLS